MTVHVKICGVRSVSDALGSVRSGASAIGVNFIPTSPRRVGIGEARAIVRALRAAGARAEVIGVVADMTEAEMRSVLKEAELDSLQLHGEEPKELVEALLPSAYKAVRVADAGDVSAARAYAGDRLLVDAKVEGMLGGSGQTFDWSLVADLARERRIVLAGGLTPENVATAVRAVRPWGVDVASGVERAAGEKDLEKVRAFVEATAAALSSPCRDPFER